MVVPLHYNFSIFFLADCLCINVHATSSFVQINVSCDKRLSLGAVETVAPITLFQLFATEIVCASFMHKCVRYFVVYAESLPPYLGSRADGRGHAHVVLAVCEKDCTIVQIVELSE